MNLSGVINRDRIIKIPLTISQYIPEESDKRQIVLHHSAGWDDARGMFAGWAADKQRVGTCMGIVDDGTIYQCFPEKYWAWHINVLSVGNKSMRDAKLKQYRTMKHAMLLEKQSLGVEVCNWGPLNYDENGSFTTWAGVPFKDEKKIINYEHGFRSRNFYERYTDQEIESLWRLIRHWCIQYNIPTTYNSDMWNVSERAISGTPGIWAHVSYRSDKTDMHPQPELIEMLKSL